MHYYIIENVPSGLALLAPISLQGLVNRSGPQVYIEDRKHTDGHWIEWYRGYGMEGIRGSWESMLDVFSNEIAGAYIIGKQDIDIEIPIATMMAGIHNRMLVTEAQAEVARQHGLLVEPLPVPTFANRLDAARWAYGNLRPLTNQALLHSFPPNHRFGFGIQDFLIANRGFSFALTTNPVTRPGERQLLGLLYETSPAFTRLLGWHNEDDTECPYIDYASRYAIIPFCVMNSLNFSFHSQIKAKGGFQQPLAEQLPELATDCAYVTFVLSDGDALHSMVDLQKGQWHNTKRGNFPFGWTIQPQLTYFAPAVLEYYYQSLTVNDEMLLGPSGIGYNYLTHFGELRKEPSPNPDGWRHEYLRQTNAYVQELDLHGGWPINRVVQWLDDGTFMRRINGANCWMKTDQMSAVYRYGIDFLDDALIQDYFTALPQCIGFFQGWYNSPGEQERCNGRQAYFPQKVLAEKPEQTLADIEKVAKEEGRPCFIPVHVNCYSMGIDGVQAVIDKLVAQRFKVVKPTDFLRLAVKYHGEQSGVYCPAIP